MHAVNILKKTHTIIIAAFIICAMVCYQLLRLNVVTGTSLQLISLIRTGIYIALIIGWGLSIRRRVLNSAVRRYLLVIALLLLFWFILRTCRHMFMYGMPVWQIYCWYGYYIPLLLIPMMGIFLAVSMGRPYGYVMPALVRALWIPNIVLILLILSNNLHQLAFYFPLGYGTGNPIYIRGPVYYFCFGWLAAEAVTFITILFLRSHVPGKKTRIWAPILSASLAFIYAIGYLLEIPLLLAIAGDMTAVFTLIMITVCETCIQGGLVQSNSKYDELFRCATINAQIVDKSYNICFQADNARTFSKELMQMTEADPVEIDQERLVGARISGGHVIWVENLSAVKDVMDKLERTGALLADNNDMLKAEVELKERDAQIDEQIRIYNKITGEVEPQLQMIEELLATEESPDKTRESLGIVCVMSAYIKRLANLILLGEGRNFLPAKELEFCFCESVENLKLCGAATSVSCHCDGIISKELAISVYAFFETVIEVSLGGLEAIFIDLNVTGENIRMSISLACNGRSDFIYENIMKTKNAVVNVSEQENDIRITFTSPKGGDGQ